MRVVAVVRKPYTFVLKLSILLNMDTIYEQLSAYGLIGELHKRVAVLRPKVSRNTILLAFEDATTPLRKKIIEKSEELLAEHKAKIPVEAE